MSTQPPTADAPLGFAPEADEPLDDRPASADAERQAVVDETRADGNAMLGMGLGLGAFGAASGLLLGAVCPLCVIAAPALVGTGLYKRVCAKRMANAAKPDDD